MQLSVVTEERDKLRNVIDELKRPKNEEAGDEAASGNVVQVLNSFAISLLSSQASPLFSLKLK